MGVGFSTGVLSISRVRGEFCFRVDFPVECEIIILLRGQRLRSESFVISCEANFADMSSADAFTGEVIKISIEATSYSVFEVGPSFNLSVSVAVTVMLVSDTSGIAEKRVLN